MLGKAAFTFDYGSEFLAASGWSVGAFYGHRFLVLSMCSVFVCAEPVLVAVGDPC